jgi:hypothetical protein
MSDESRLLEEQMLSQALEKQLSSQIDDAEKINVDVRTDLGKMVQGKADSVAVAGSGLTMQKDIRVQEIQIYADRLSINPLSAIFGQIELNQPIDTIFRVVLTEEDINRALNSDYVKAKLSPLELYVDGQIVPVELQLPLSLHLPGGGKMQFSANMVVHEPDNTQQLAFTASFFTRTHDRPALLNEFRCTSGMGTSVALTAAFMAKLKEVVNLPYFQVEGITLRIKELSVQEGSLTLIAEAHVYQIPSFEG